jgi:hypothetical protein
MNFDAGRLWVPNIKDQMSGLYAQRYLRYETTAQAAAVIASSVGIAEVTCPADKMRIIEGVTVWALGGAAQQLEQAEAVLYSTTGLQLMTGPIPLDRYTAAARQHGYITPLGWAMIPGEQIGITLTFNAGAAVNQAQWSFWGFDVPRGNLQ